MVLKRLLAPEDRRKDEHGAIAVLFAIFAVTIFVLAAFVVDIGYARSEQRGSQASADAAALAGANALFPGTGLTADYVAAEAAVKSYALNNFNVAASEWTGCTDSGALPTASTTGCISFEVTSTYARVRVKMPTKTLTTGFGRVAGKNTIKVSSAARARIERGNGSPCGLCILGSGTHDLQNGDAFVDGANVHFNGNVNVGSNGLVVTNGQITVEGSATGPLANYEPDPTTGQPKAVDPLIDYPNMPSLTGLTVKSGSPCGTASAAGPGIYGSVDLRNNACVLQAGLYVIVGTWDLAGNASTVLSGTGVTLFFACGTTSAPVACTAPGQAGGTMDFSGSGTLSITAPTTGPYAGMALWYDRNNNSTLKMSGNGSAGFTGSIYAPAAKLLMNGNGCTNPFNALIVINDLEMNGNPACIRSTYTLSSQVKPPPSGLHLDQ